MSCRHVNAGGYRCPRPSLPAHRGFCRQHAPLPHLPPPVPLAPQPSRRGGRGGGAGRPSTSGHSAPHPAPEGRRRGAAVTKTPTTEQLLRRLERLRTTSPSAESAWSEDSDHETPTLGSARQHIGSGCTGDSSGAESSPEGLDPVDYLHHAGVYTVEEVALLARDKLVRHQALYIQQFSRLHHLLREGRRRYLRESKLERQAEAEAARERQLAEEEEEQPEEVDPSVRELSGDTGGASGSRMSAQPGQYAAEEKLRALWRYHRHRGVCAVLRRKSWERRANTTAPQGPRCIYTEESTRCSERCLPGSKFCMKHILNDPYQVLFVPCAGRRNLTLEQRDEEFAKNRQKAAEAPAGSAGGKASGSSGNKQPPKASTKTVLRAPSRRIAPIVKANIKAVLRASRAAVRGSGKVGALRAKLAARAVAVRLATIMAAKQAKRRKQRQQQMICREPVLCVFRYDMRCIWHKMHWAGRPRSAKHASKKRRRRKGSSAKSKAGVKKNKVDPKAEPKDTDLDPQAKRIKMEVDEPTTSTATDGAYGDMKMETSYDLPDGGGDDAGSCTNGNQTDQLTESTLSATSPRGVDDDMDDSGRDMDVCAEEVVLQPPPSTSEADDVDLIAAAQGVAVVGAQEEIAVQQDEDSLTNPPTAVNEVEVS